jgi:alpha-beta hydrolase superfamily lysophospholipase
LGSPSISGDLDRRHHAAETTLIGFSSGGGFVLRVAGGRLGTQFSRFILLSPFLRHDAPNSRSMTGGGWTSVAVPRIVGLQLATKLGMTSFNGLPVLAFAVAAGNPNHLTTSYSYRLLTNFSPDDDYIGDLRRAPAPLVAVAGTDDEIFQTDRLRAALAAGNQVALRKAALAMTARAIVTPGWYQPTTEPLTAAKRTAQPPAGSRPGFADEPDALKVWFAPSTSCSKMVSWFPKSAMGSERIQTSAVAAPSVMASLRELKWALGRDTERPYARSGYANPVAGEGGE